MARLTVHFTTDLGARVSLEVDGGELHETLRHYGRQGWYSGELPPTGFVLPYHQEPYFDWSLLAGRRVTDETVWCRGHTWTRRERPGGVAFVRPALAFDPAGVRHMLEDDREYVILAVFADPGEAPPRSVPEPAPEQRSEPTSVPSSPAPVPRTVDERVLKMRENMDKLLAQLRAQDRGLEAEAVMDRYGYSQTETEDIGLGRQVYKELRALLR